jgi:hypothetical protein
VSTISPFSEDVSAPRSTPAAEEGGVEESETWYTGEQRPTPFASTTEADQHAEAQAAEPEDFDFAGADEEVAHPILSAFPLPRAVVEALSGGLSSLAVMLAAGAGYRDVGQLTNIVFYFRHPDMIGRKIRPDERELAAEWVSIRDRIVKPALQAPPAPAGTATAPAVTKAPPVSGTGLSSARLEWPDAPSPEALAFMRAVYDRHAERSRARGAGFVSDLPKDALAPIEGREARKDAAEAARALLAEARSALAAQGLADRVRIGIVSAYRPATRQFEIWQGRTFDGKSSGGGFPHYYREAIKKGIVRAGDFSPKAVDEVAAYLGGYVASPGYSNHQDGLAFDFGTGAVGKGLAKIGWKSWFRHWLEQNARRHHFVPLATEAWHWTYHPPGAAMETMESEAAVPTGVREARVEVRRVPVLARHRGVPPDLILRWNEMASVPQEIDVVVHLHGFWYSRMTLPRDIERVSGLDLRPPAGTEAPGRSRPTLTVLPRGHNTGVKQTNGPYHAYTFPALEKTGGLAELIRFAVERFAAETRGAVPRIGRLILTAHSGGGRALLRILEHHDPDPHQVHVYDALYWPPTALIEWARKRIRRDRDAVRAGASVGDYMPTAGGALRVFYQDRTRRGTRPSSLALRDAIQSELGDGLERWYRVEASKYDHFQIPRLYGWRVLADASADVPEAYVEVVGRGGARETAFEEGDAAELFAEEEAPPTNDLPEPVSEAPYPELTGPEWQSELWGEDEESAGEYDAELDPHAAEDEELWSAEGPAVGVDEAQAFFDERQAEVE